jgi:hypothetical protein
MEVAQRFNPLCSLCELCVSVVKCYVSYTHFKTYTNEHG